MNSEVDDVEKVGIRVNEVTATLPEVMLNTSTIKSVKPVVVSAARDIAALNSALKLCSKEVSLSNAEMSNELKMMELFTAVT
ncbi:hypothetical protein CYMTET_47858 [Cymbomonas tetramitiformis]|uniref:Uncharacterized protein n=1 Tax=Cymbomonas tetramitiformis TaxID=36881 RepID=A0AAE0EVJ7_9CHLO|nr:hypothetical protein CYMTET_47858 [Cymbomonas tetramitiformis]